MIGKGSRIRKERDKMNRKKSKLREKVKNFVAVTVLGATALFGATFSAMPIDVQAQSAESENSWGPQDRATFTWEEPAEYVTFNSITDNPKMGDERNFVRIRKANTTDTLTDSVDLEVGQEYEVWVWFHNNAKAKLNKRENGGVGIATDVRLRVEQPEVVQGDTSAVIRGIVSASNADPQEVWDEAFAYADSTMLLRYVPNSATIHSLGDIDGQVINSEAMFGESGAYLGYWNDMWGTLPGCNEYSGYVTYHFVVDQAGFKLSKTVAKDGEDNYSEQLTVEPGDTLSFKLEYNNTGTINQLDITGHDRLPEGLTYVPGSSYFTANFNPEGNTISDNLFDEGVNLGDYKPGDSMSLTYKVKVEDDMSLFPCGDTVVYNDASIATENGTGYDKAEVTVHRECNCATNPEMPGCQEQTEKPEETCATNPDLPGCQELPNTGPVEIVMAVLIIAGIGGAGYYFYRTRKTLKTVESGVMDGGGSKHASHYHAGLEEVEPEKASAAEQTKRHHAKRHDKKDE